MPISEKTRKILWGRSGNRCAMCRQPLVVDETDADGESIVGDECHIISAKAQGPRHDPHFPADQIDGLNNLILMCRIHHKMVDDQRETYTVEMLAKLKANHEAWVLSSLAEEKAVPPVRIRRVKGNIPSHLIRLTSGRDVTAIIGDALAYSFDHDQPKSETDVGLIAAFLQTAQDWGEIWAEIEAGERVRVAFQLGEALDELERTGYWVFGGREVQRLEGGFGAPQSFPVAILHVLRSTNPALVKISPDRPPEKTDKTSDSSDRPRSNSDV